MHIVDSHRAPDFVGPDCSPAVLAEADTLDRRTAEALGAFLARFPAADVARRLLD
ncbi:hypothetical protein [Mycolicibacter algericus]|uniref:hypothetical protein n=1 Tax=Mycolicibacter algericus TaxID=1288388 RepID=UPI001962637A|nr:hypothetical protein [Mycolicibacter algericus]